VTAVQERRQDALRAAGWVLGSLGALVGLLGPVWAGALDDPMSLVGLVSGSGTCVLGAVILDRQPANRSAWGFLVGGLLLVAVSASYSVAAGWVRAGEVATSPVGGLATAAEVTGALAGASLPLFQFLFPDGRLPSRRWRPVFGV
jgi:two-component system, NarL family, sensor kinase